MTIYGLTFAALLLGAFLLDGLVRPRKPVFSMFFARELPGYQLLACMMTALFGLFLACCGNLAVSAGLALGVLTLLMVASNAKHAMLGEPLLFSDLALIGAVFRHPQFYLSAVAIWQRIVAGIVAVILFALLGWLFVPEPQAHLFGLAILAMALLALRVSLKSASMRDLARTPDIDSDVRRLGLLPTLLLYWLRWRESQDPAERAGETNDPSPDSPDLVVVVQCESFADPAELFDDPHLALPALARARENACQHGKLMVSGFGAYTMRTEYGVLFGRDEQALGFRRYDPFLTALRDKSHALPARLKPHGWRSLFVHPHDMRFYGRDRIMPAGGFAELVGEDRFAAPGPGEGRYVTDAAMADEIVALSAQAEGPTLIYAVTIENHGPWAPDGHPGGDLRQSYLRLARNSDAMLATLAERIGALGRRALLVFFGDHRPSIPGVTAPGGDRHTPYVMLRLGFTGRTGAGQVAGPRNEDRHCRQVDLTPAELHHAILAAVLGETPTAPNMA